MDALALECVDLAAAILRRPAAGRRAFTFVDRIVKHFT
jgi:hypothetical protein